MARGGACEGGGKRGGCRIGGGGWQCYNDRESRSSEWLKFAMPITRVFSMSNLQEACRGVGTHAVQAGGGRAAGVGTLCSRRGELSL